MLGFDARFAPDVYLAREWTFQRRERYLLDPDVSWPLSVDTTVWPSVFTDPAASRLRTDPLDSLMIAPNLVDYRQRAFGLWSSLHSMEEAIVAHHARERSVEIAIELFADTADHLDSDWSVRLSNAAAPDPARVEWPIAGFDVADVGFVSGIANVGFLNEERLRILSRWGRCVNANGLLTSADVAFDVRSEIEDIAAEHAPFHVYQLRIKPVSGRCTASA